MQTQQELEPTTVEIPAERTWSSVARERLEQVITRGATRAASVIEEVQSNAPQDEVVEATNLGFHTAFDGVGTGTPNLGVLPMHPHALDQACSRVGIPTAYAHELLGKPADDHFGRWGKLLLRDMLSKHYQLEGTRYLLRAARGQVRGFLSDRYRRLDSRPLIEAATAAFKAAGALPYEGYCLDTKVALKAIVPRVYEPVPGEVVAFGVEWENSDYGDGALAINSFILRLRCLNGMIGADALRKVHLGGRLPDDLRLSAATYDLDTRTMASATGDVVRGILGPSVERGVEAIRRAHASGIDPRSALTGLRKRGLTKGETEQVSEAFNSPDVENMPAGNTTWRLSNAVSWVAGHLEDERRKLELMKVAGAMLEM